MRLGYNLPKRYFVVFMSYKLVWTVIAALGVLTQVPGMLEAHSFNTCISNKISREAGNTVREERVKRDIQMYAHSFCNGGYP